MIESKIIAAYLSDRTDYDSTVRYVDRKGWSPMGVAFLETVDTYYQRDSAAKSVDLDVLKEMLNRRFKDVPRHREQAMDYLEGVLNTDSSKINVISEITAQRRAAIGTELADALLAQDDERIREFLAEYESLTDDSVMEELEDEVYSNIDVMDLFKRMEEEGQWKLGPKLLSDKIKGGLRPGHSVVVAARPERGKTLFAIQFTSSLLEQGAKVLYIGNEDPIDDLVLRCLNNLSGMNTEDIKADPQTAMEKAYEKGYANVTFVGLSPGTLYEIEALVRKYEPDVLIVDQMRNVKADTENNTQRLEEVAQGLRDIARRHRCLVISMTQVGDSGRNKLVLNDGDIDGSNTGVPGACDVIILIGSNDEYEMRDLRMLTLAKNKRGGNHENFTVSVNRELSRVASHVGSRAS